MYPRVNIKVNKDIFVSATCLFIKFHVHTGVGERKRGESSGFGGQPASKRARLGSPAEAVTGTSLEVDPVDLVPNVLQALDTHNSDKLVIIFFKATI